MKVRFSISFLLFLFSAKLLAQDDAISINGRIVDAKTGAPIEGAACFMASYQYLGAISDARGNFSLKIPRVLANDSIVISHISYKPKYTAVSSIPDAGTIDFVLDWKINVLDEVLVKGDNETLQAILLKALEKIPSNYPDKPHLIKSFYRKLSTEGSTYTHLEEATLSIEDYSYRRPFESVKIKVTNFRETKDRGAIDSSFYKASKRIVNNSAKDRSVTANPLQRLYQGNFLRAWYNDNNLFNPSNFRKFEKDYGFQFVDFSVIEGDTIYQIAFHEGPLAKEPTGQTYFKINMKDMAILEYQFARGNKDALLYKTIVKFKKTGDRYYPEFIEVTQSRYMINKSETDHEYDIETYWFETPDLKNTRSKTGTLIDRLNYAMPEDMSNDIGAWEACEICKQHPLDKNALPLLRDLKTQ